MTALDYVKDKYGLVLSDGTTVWKKMEEIGCGIGGPMIPSVLFHCFGEPNVHPHYKCRFSDFPTWQFDVPGFGLFITLGRSKYTYHNQTYDSTWSSKDYKLTMPVGITVGYNGDRFDGVIPDISNLKEYLERQCSWVPRQWSEDEIVSLFKKQSH